MKCESFQAAYSARLDGEESGLESAAVDVHLATCSSCRAWAAAADQLTRLSRDTPALPVPDLTAEIMAHQPAPKSPAATFRETFGRLRRLNVSRFAGIHRGAPTAPATGIGSAGLTAPPARPAAGNARPVNAPGPPALPARPAAGAAAATAPVMGSAAGVARLGLTLVALAQLAISIPALAGADAGASVHIAHEQGSWALALAVGLLVVVWRPARAHGILPLVTVLVAALTLTSGLDIVAGRTAAGAEAPHGLAILGLMLLWWVAHPTMGQRQPHRQPRHQPA